MNPRDIIYDWNESESAPRPQRPLSLVDETLRDGLQSPSITEPSTEEKLRIITLMDALGIADANLGMPGSSTRAKRSVEQLARAMRDLRLRVRPSCAGRTHDDDLRAIADVAQRLGGAIDANLFIGSSRIRQLAEGWSLDWIVERTRHCVGRLAGEGLNVMYVTEDTTRSRPEDLQTLYAAAIEAGAMRICIADTVGQSMPWGVRRLVTFVRGIVERTNPAVQIDWHGHSDRGLGVINAIAAAEAGADRLHGCALGIGERAGNTSLDLLLVNLHLLGWIDNDVAPLPAYVSAVAQATGTRIADNYPVFGRDAFRTSTGVHASAIVKAQESGSRWLADRVYSAVPAAAFGLAQQIDVGPMSGMSNVIFWMHANGYPQDESLAAALLRHAKTCSRVQTSDELHAVAARWSDARRSSASQATLGTSSARF
jgi:2-isopropylmalate synthase